MILTISGFFFFEAYNDVDVRSIEEDAKTSKTSESASFDVVPSSENIENLIKALEFNTIDIYR